MEEHNYFKILPPTDLRSLCGSWPELDADAITKEIIEDRERDAEIERERDGALPGRSLASASAPR